MTAADAGRAAALDRFLPQIARALGVPVEHLPLRLYRAQIARLVGLGSARSLSSTASRGAQRGEPRWVAYRAMIGRGAHSVPLEQVAAWLAVDAGLLGLPAPGPAAKEKEGVRDGADRDSSLSLDLAWANRRGVVHRCEG